MRLISLAEQLEQYETALQRLQHLGVRIEGTRLATYRKILRQAVSDEKIGKEDHQATDRFRNAVLESAEIVSIAELPAEFFNNAHVREKLRQLSSGGEFYTGEGQDPARDFSLEFAVAAQLNAKGEFGGFSEFGGDVTLASGHPVECKRISSLSRARARAKEARDQLDEIYEHSHKPGLVLFDITKPLLVDHGFIDVASDDALAEEAEKRASVGAIGELRRRLDLDKIRSPAALGMVTRTVSRGTAGGPSNIRRAEIWQAISYFDDPSEENRLFLSLASKFGSGELRNATVDDVRRALNAYQNFLIGREGRD